MYDGALAKRVTFRLDAVADQAYLCLQPCEGAVAGDRVAWETRPLTQVEPGVWEAAVPLPPGWWRFRYYTRERGVCFYAEPAESVLHMDGLDAMLHVSSTDRSPGGGFLAQAFATALASVVPAARLARSRPRRAVETDVRSGMFGTTSQDFDQHICALPDADEARDRLAGLGSFAASEQNWARLT